MSFSLHCSKLAMLLVLIPAASKLWAPPGPPFNNPVYLPGGTGSSAFGLTDMELGVKYGFIKQTKHRPQIGSFTMFEIPTGNYSKGLGVGRGGNKLPLWAEREF